MYYTSRMCFQIMFLSFSISLLGQNVKQYQYYQDVYPIVSNKCFKCHNNSENAPFRLLTYYDVLNKKEIIKKVISEHIMPPVIIDTIFKNFENVILLSNHEREKILAWIDRGCEKGTVIKVDSNKTESNSHAKIKISLDREHSLGNTPKDQYLFSIISLPINDSIIVSNYDFVIKNKYLHHAELLDLDTNSKYIEDANILKEEYELKRYRDDVRINRYLFGWFPGSTAGIFPNNTGMKLFGNRKYLLVLHYSPTIEDHKDKSYLNLFQLNKTNYREILEYALYGTRRHIVNNRGEPFIKKDEIKTFHYEDIVKYDMSMFAVYFHAHHLCTNMIAYAITPSNDTINLLKIDDWNFNWQFTYRLDKYEKIPQGSIIHCIATYDNTSSNIENPNNPPKDVNASFFSDDEMLEFFILHLKSIEGDTGLKINYSN